MSINDELKALFARYQDIFSDYGGIDIVDVNQSGMGEDKLLHLAASHGECREVELLLKCGADVNAKGDIGMTPLHYAASKGRLDVVKLLVRYGAKENIRNDFGETPLDWAKNNNHVEVVKFLRERQW